MATPSIGSLSYTNNTLRVTAQQRHNAKAALHDMWPSIPSKNISLRWYLTAGVPNEPSTDTVACFGTWCAMWPAFAAQGLRVAARPSVPTLHGMPLLKGASSKRLSWQSASRVCRMLFGCDDLFAPRACGDAEYGMSDKRAVASRLRALLKNSTVV